MLTLEEALGSLDRTADLPGLDNYILILQECRQKASLAHVKHIHKHICSKGLEAQTVLGNHLVPTFVDCGSVTTAQQVFNRLDHCSEHAWTSLMQGYTEGGEFLHAIHLYQKMEKDSVCPSRFTFMALLKACAKMKLVERGQEIHAEIAAKGLDDDTCVGNTLVDMYAKAGSLAEAREVFDKMPVRDSVSWTALIAGYAEHGLSEEALNCLEQMQSESLFPNASTYVCTLKACASIEAIDRGQEIHTGIAEEGLEKDLFVGCSLVHMYAKCGSIAEAEDAFNTLPVRDVVSWNALITGYAEHGLEEEALGCFRRMQLDGIPPNAAVFVCGLKVCAQIGALEKGQEIHAELIKEGYDSDHTVEKTVIDMYAKCGLLAEALDVFNELPVRDSLSWTSIIAGYAEHDFAEEALSCLEHMQLEGVSAEALTLIWSLKACGRIEALGRGQQIHTDIAKEGFEEDCFLGGCLVDMYAKCGLLAEAREVFDELPVRDVVSWTTLIAGYAEFGLGEEALTCFQEMQRDGVSADAVSYVSSLKACATLGATDRGREIHTEIANKGLEIDPLLGSSLMDMYAKCGWLAEARVLFEELPVRAEFTWNALISGYTTHGFFNEALGCFQQMQLEGVFRSAVSFVHGLKVCCSTRAMHRGQEIHSIIVEQEMEREPLVGCSLVDMYAKCASLTEAREVFDELPIRNTFAWNTLIAGYVEHGFDKDALNCFQQMQVEGVSPNTHTFVCTLKACGSIGAIDRGREIHADIAKKNYERDIYVCNILVDMYTKCGSLADAQEVFYRLPVRDVVTWTALIAGYAEHGIPKKALDCFEQMENEGIPFDAITLDCGLKACSSVGAMYKGRKIYNAIVKKGFERDPFIVSTLVSMYARFGSLAEARVVFDEIPDPDVISWNTLLAGYAEHGLCEEAFACFSQMQLDGLFLCAGSWNSIILAYAEQGESERAFELYTQMQEQGLSPDTLIFLSISEGCGYNGALETGKRIHAQICGIDPEANDVIMATALIDMYSKCGSMIDAQKVFDAMPLRDLISWNALLIGYCRHGEIERVLDSFESMIREGTQPDAVTFICILTACSHVGLVCEGEKYIQDMSNEYGIIPSIKHHNCIVDLLGRAGQLDEAMVMAEIMPFQHDFVVWNTVMGACQKWSNPKLGRKAFECAVSVEEEHAAAFILMSNIYADTLKDGGED